MICKEWQEINETEFFIFLVGNHPSAGAVKYADCISATILHPVNECPVYDTKNIGWRVSNLWALRNVEFASISITPRSTLIWSDSAI